MGPLDVLWDGDGVPPPPQCGETNTCRNSTFQPLDVGGKKKFWLGLMSVAAPYYPLILLTVIISASVSGRGVCLLSTNTTHCDRICFSPGEGACALPLLLSTHCDRICFSLGEGACTLPPLLSTHCDRICFSRGQGRLGDEFKGQILVEDSIWPPNSRVH